MKRFRQSILPAILFVAGVIVAMGGTVANTAIATRTTLNTFWGDATLISSLVTVGGIGLSVFCWKAMEKPEFPIRG